MADHPTGETVEILGLNQATNGRSCPDHDNCGSVVKPDVVVTLMTRTMKTMLDHERANEQSHATGVRLNANHGQTESEGKKDLIQAKQNNEADSSRQF